MDCRFPQSCSHIIEYPFPSSPKILSPENCCPVPGMILDGRDGLLGYLDTDHHTVGGGKNR